MYVVVKTSYVTAANRVSELCCIMPDAFAFDGLHEGCIKSDIFRYNVPQFAFRSTSFNDK